MCWRYRFYRRFGKRDPDEEEDSTVIVDSGVQQRLNKAVGKYGFCRDKRSKVKAFVFTVGLLISVLVGFTSIMFTIENRAWLHDLDLGALVSITDKVYVPGTVFVKNGISTIQGYPSNLISKHEGKQIEIGESFEKGNISMNGVIVQDVTLLDRNVTKGAAANVLLGAALGKFLRTAMYQKSNKFVFDSKQMVQTDSGFFESTKNEGQILADLMQVNLHLLEAVKDSFWINFEWNCDMVPVLPECQCKARDLECICVQSNYFRKTALCAPLSP